MLKNVFSPSLVLPHSLCICCQIQFILISVWTIRILFNYMCISVWINNSEALDLLARLRCEYQLEIQTKVFDFFFSMVLQCKTLILPNCVAKLRFKRKKKKKLIPSFIRWKCEHWSMHWEFDVCLSKIMSGQNETTVNSFQL